MPSQAASAAAKAGLSPSATPASPRSGGGGGGVARLCFRLQDGTSLKEQFDMKQTYTAILPLFNCFIHLLIVFDCLRSIGDLFKWLDSRVPSRYHISHPCPPIHLIFFSGSTTLFATCPPHPTCAAIPQRSRLQVSHTQCIQSLLTSLF